MNFTHIHVHTDYSFLDGFNKIENAVKRAKELGMTSLAITDHNHLGGTLEFQRVCNKNDIKPLLGLEGYWTHDLNMLAKDADERYDIALEKAMLAGIEIPKKATKKAIKELISDFAYDTKQYHILFIAINQTGWNNLIKLQSEAARLCTYKDRYTMDDSLIAKYSEGLIMTTACVGTIISKYIEEGDYKSAKEQLNKWKNIFGDNLFLEIQPLNIDKQRRLNYHLVKWAKELNIRLVATNDVHWTYKEQYDDHDTLLCIGTGKLKSDEDRLRYSNDFWLKSYDEMIESFDIQVADMKNEYTGLQEIDYVNKVIEALENTNLIANAVEDNIQIGSKTSILPQIETPDGSSAEDYFTLNSYKELYKYKDKHPEIDILEYERRLAEELDIINTKGYSPYMLIEKDIIDYCDNNDIPVGPGRGSAGGSLALFLNNIVKVIDPIKYKLLFFRFLTKDRTALPDIDSDFSYHKRHLIINYIKNKYGYSKVSHIGTYTTMGVKNGIKDVARVLNVPFQQANDITKKIDEITNKTPGISFKDLDEYKDSLDKREAAAYNDFVKLENENKELFRLARAFEGVKRGCGVHASGILITPVDIESLVPTRIDKDGNMVTLFTMTEAEDVGLVKFDILGLKTLDILDETMKRIDKTKNILDLYKIIENHLEDEEIFKMITNKETDGLFQIESDMFKGLVSNIKPNNINDITAITSIGRPGPLSAKMDVQYAERKSNPDLIKEPIRNTMDIVKDSLGTIIYQESIMEIAIRVAKVNQNQADSLFRKAIAKKKKDLFEICRRVFVYGKLNIEPPVGNDNTDGVLYDPKGKHGPAILGGINNGYDEKELNDFFHSLEGYSSYLFNKSHACFYSVLTVATAYLKKYHLGKFLCSVLDMQDNLEDLAAYLKVAKDSGFTISLPNILTSEKNFSVNDKTIFFGLGSIKGLGEMNVDKLLEIRSSNENNINFLSLEDIIKKIPKKVFNKKAGVVLIKSGAFDAIDSNRIKLLNDFYTIRKEKDEEILDENQYDESMCMEFEKETLGMSLTYTPWWDDIKAGETIEQIMSLIDVREKTDKNGNLMGFVKGNINNCTVDCVIFAKTYSKNVDLFDLKRNKAVLIKGKKDEKGSLIVSSVKECKKLIDTSLLFSKTNKNNEMEVTENVNLMKLAVDFL